MVHSLLCHIERRRKSENVKILITYTKKFDLRNGTKLIAAMRSVGVPGL
jgi:hypothetical protein